MAQAAQNLESIEKIKKKQGKRFALAVEKTRASQKEFHSIEEALETILSFPKTKFDETCELAFKLNVDPKQADQMIRGANVLPHGTGKSSRVVVFAKGEKENEAKEAGADEVGADDLAEKIQKGYSDFTSVVATPDMMAVVSKVARVLGPKGLMPNPKLGTVTMDLKKVIGDLKRGRVEFRVDKAGVVQAPFGKLSFGAEKLKENLMALIEQIVKLRPSSVKGSYILSIYISTSMGPSIRLDHNQLASMF